MITVDSKDSACLESKEKHAQNPIEPNFNPNAFTTKRKQNKKSKKYTNFGITGSMLSSIVSELGLDGLVDGELTHLSFDCPKPLRLAFKTATRSQKTNVCDELQKYMVNYVVAFQTKKHALGDTLSKLLPVEFSIGEINLHQYCQTKPRRWVNPVAELQGKDVSNNCEMNGCSAVAVSSGEFQGKRLRLCKDHTEVYSKVTEKTMQVSVGVVNDELDDRCKIGRCSNEAKEFLIYQPKGQVPKEYMVCGYHTSELIKTNAWRFKK